MSPRSVGGIYVGRQLRIRDVDDGVHQERIVAPLLVENFQRVMALQGGKVGPGLSLPSWARGRSGLSRSGAMSEGGGDAQAGSSIAKGWTMHIRIESCREFEESSDRDLH